MDLIGGERVTEQTPHRKVTFFAIPRQIGGTDPSPCWIYLDMNNALQFNYANMTELQGSKRLPVKHLSMTTYSSTGRQNDFKYWYDISEQPSTICIRLVSEANPSQQKFWQFQIGFVILFRGFTVQIQEQKFNNNIVKLTRSESQIENGEVSTQVQIEPENQIDEDEIWNHNDSDWEDEPKE